MEKEDFENIWHNLMDKPRDLLLFHLIAKTNLQLKQILCLKIEHLLHHRIGETIVIELPNSKNIGSIFLSDSMYTTLNLYLEKYGKNSNSYLIRSQKGNKPLNPSSTLHLINSWYKAAGITTVSGMKPLRKWGKEYAKFLTDDAEKKILDQDPIGGLIPVQQSTTLKVRVYNQLAKSIVSGKIPPGRRLIIDQIAKQMNVSVVPVREAFNRLHQAGLISINKKLGTTVTKLTINDMREIAHIRILLEVDAAVAATKIQNDSTIARMKELQESLIKAGDLLIKAKDHDAVSNYLNLNHQFHFSIYRTSEKQILVKLIEGLWDRYFPYLHILALETEEWNPNQNAHIHDRMLEGMEQSDSKKVAYWLKKDIHDSENILISHFANRVSRNGSMF